MIYIVPGADLKANDGIYSRYCILEHDQMMRTLNAKFVARWTDQTQLQKSSSSYGMGAKPMSTYYKSMILFYFFKSYTKSRLRYLMLFTNIKYNQLLDIDK